MPSALGHWRLTCGAWVALRRQPEANSSGSSLTAWGWSACTQVAGLAQMFDASVRYEQRAWLGELGGENAIAVAPDHEDGHRHAGESKAVRRRRSERGAVVVDPAVSAPGRRIACTYRSTSWPGTNIWGAALRRVVGQFESGEVLTG